MKVIEAEDLSKNFRVKRKEKGMRGSIRSFFTQRQRNLRGGQCVFWRGGG